MNWLIIAFPLAIFYIVWFTVLIRRNKYEKGALLFAAAHFPYLLLNLVAPFRGIFDSGYYGYHMGWINLPKGFLVPLVVGGIVVISFILATKALQNKMDGWWRFSFIFDLFLVIMVGIPVFIDIVKDIDAATIMLGEYLTISGIWVAGLILLLLTVPTFYACYYAASKGFSARRVQGV